MKKLLSTIAAICFVVTAAADSVPFGNGQLSFTPIARNAVRIQYQEGEVKQALPEWIYVNNTPVKDTEVKVEVDPQHQKVSVKDASGRVVFTATKHQFTNGKATLAFNSPNDEYLFGLGQFQDGFTNTHPGEHPDLHPHAFVEQGLWHSVEQLWHDGIQPRRSMRDPEEKGWCW